MAANLNSLGFPVFDADNHLYETTDALTKFLPPEYKGAIDYVDVHGRTKIMVRGQISDYIPNPTFERVGRPGAQEEYFRIGNPDGKSYREIIGRGIDCPPAFRDAAHRLELLDEQGIDFAIMLPTLASLVEERMRDDPELCAAAIHALNLWMLEEWPYAYKDRIFSTPIITPGLLDKAMEELDFLLENGVRVILMRPAPAWGFQGPARSPCPSSTPTGPRSRSRGSSSSSTPRTRATSATSTNGRASRARRRPSPSRSRSLATLQHSFRDIQDAVTSLIAHGTLRRHPKLKIALIENGAGWVPGLLENLDHTYRTMPQAFAEKPSDTYKRHFWIHPFHEEDPRKLVQLLGADNVIFGSDFPHVEGMSNPLSYIDELAGLPEEDIKKIMGGNMIDLLGIKVPAGV